VPRIELIPEVLHGANDPYHWEYDNLPLKNIITRQNLINAAVDNALEDLRNAAGTAGSFGNRMNQSIEDDGSLKTSAIDSAAHSIEEHTDSASYVRMSASQSAKLDLIEDEATNFGLLVNSDGTTLLSFTSGTLTIEPSNTITPTIESPSTLKLHTTFSADAVHQHHYNGDPVHADQGDPDYVNYKVNSMSSAYMEGSLRVHINGMRIFESDEVYVPGALVDDPWTLLSFIPDHDAGTFELSAAITNADVIKIDYDISLA
jgi:hypothetical protein